MTPPAKPDRPEEKQGEISEAIALAEELGKWEERKAEAVKQITYLRDRLRRFGVDEVRP